MIEIKSWIFDKVNKGWSSWLKGGGRKAHITNTSSKPRAMGIDLQ